MKKLTSLVVAMLAVPFIYAAPVEEAVPESVMAQLVQDQGINRATIKNIASVSWRDGRFLNVRVYECNGSEITTRSYTGERKDGEWEGKWEKEAGFKATGNYVAACSWVEETGKTDTVHIRVFVSNKEEEEITEHLYEGRSDVKPGEKDAGTWSTGTKKFKGVTSCVDVSYGKKSGKPILNMFAASNKGKVTYYQQFEGSAWKKVDL